ncbi:hydroxyethylthiazole kinase [Acinetobacter bereziniae]|jgi:hydroxyethylthiazole kinase|uniref:hydroxyethylthiazole kinase n=1 Tax=Acinetobacter bereziniae TaxID=106648 RepID=UPI00125006A8|nr:hydroxyethylthiazole kinase [Acinetobacter bereziniae]MBJ9903206.1 hydroxyethylthiazole kinase [Acinetobacter bereziniae]MCU4317662.1 hydroxyethylthiazole kinase [Acinetobacter bereziniae]MCU4435419.1 hydroxyethylthiazole kinase [Acinetobacter bereziniae]MCU4600447.1 hydroxyethylthiazole kinase [Acinetobacter bereziniae]MCV2443551.1 hydroxyethylthiazole kinase [Acinetobacter bereziniae]
MNHPENITHSQTDQLHIQTDVILQKVVDAWTELQTQQPLVHCITNSVAANYAANILLAAGASPAMIDNPFEAESFASIAAALSINLGTPTSEQMQAMQISAQTVANKNTPWVLDPVGYGPFLKWRSEMVDQLVLLHPTIIRGNASEISALAGNQVESKGVDSAVSSNEVYLQAQALLNHSECVAISGESDFVLSKELHHVIQINGGSFLQPKVTATGCALGALIAAYSAVTTPAIATISAHIHFAIAGKLAFEKASAVGSFNVAFLDEIYQMSANKIWEYSDIQVLGL